MYNNISVSVVRCYNTTNTGINFNYIKYYSRLSVEDNVLELYAKQIIIYTIIIKRNNNIISAVVLRAHQLSLSYREFR